MASPSRAQLPLPDPGSLVLSLEQVKQIFHVELPPAGVGLSLTADYPLDHPLVINGVPYTNITLDITDQGGVTTHNAVPADGEGGEGIEECSDTTFSAAGRKWEATALPIGYAVNDSTVPSYITKDGTLRSIRSGHRVWADTNWTCSDDDPIDFAFAYEGTSDKAVEYDGTNIVMFDRLDLPVATTYVYWTNDVISEADMVLNSNYRWGNKRTTTRYNVMNVMAHETGHSLGLDDLGSSHEALTMFGIVDRHEFKKTTLGQGDVQGAETLTP